MARMEMDCILENLGYFSQVCIIGNLTKTLIMFSFLFPSSLDIFLLVLYKYFVYDKGA